MGVVYRAISETTGRPAAVKVISGEVAQRSKSYERFRREAEILQQFRHPNIVRFLALGRYQGTSYFAMEYVAGENLEQLLNRRGPLPWREAVDFGIQVSEALQYAHEHGVVHRDLKPSNLMVSEKGRVKLTDFGIAKDLDATALTATGRTLGTAAYMAPEQIRGAPAISHKTDLYALGVVLYQILTGRPTFEGTSAVVLMHCHLNEPAPRPSAKVAEIPVALDKLIVQLLAKDPADRPWDAAAVALALTEIRDKASRGETVPMVWPTDGDPTINPVRTGLEPTKKAKKPSTSKANKRIFVPERQHIEIGLLVLALVAMSGFLGYMLWPYSEEYLYSQANILMASEHRSDWERAREKYLDTLDRRFPESKYRSTVQSWRDRIELSRAIDRAVYLETPHPTPINKTQNVGEDSYVQYFSLASEASKRHDDLLAIHYWDQMSANLKDKEFDPEIRRWYLLAQKRSEDLKSAVEQRRRLVTSLLEQLAKARTMNRATEVANIANSIMTRYGDYTDLTDVLSEAGLTLPSPEAAVPEPSAPPVDEKRATPPGLDKEKPAEPEKPEVSAPKSI
ncbi:serine/threonine-protein kinase [Singulisphaera sp. PoT]|uniref:serine/threonine-protein kinase n=1 Tax=Singulisphaera sp. PoT TaxID=3411797 RepID=UPI003BF53E10